MVVRVSYAAPSIVVAVIVAVLACEEPSGPTDGVGHSHADDFS